MKKLYTIFIFRQICLPVLLVSFLLTTSTDMATAQQQLSSRFKVPKLLERQKASVDAGGIVYRLAATTISKPLTGTSYASNGTGWVLNSTISYTYDNQGRITEEITRNSNGTFNDKVTYAFDQHGHMTGFALYQWSAGNWVMLYGSQSAITYDSNGRITEVLNNSWDEGAWKLSYRSVLTYNTSGNLLTVTEYNREGSNWLIDEQYTFTYTAPNTAPVAITYMEPNEAGTLVNEDRIIDLVWHTFNPADINSYFNDDMWASYISQEWENGTWVNEEKYTATFGENNSYVGIEQEWENGAWVNGWRYTRTYDAHGNSLLSQDEAWLNGAWSIEFGYKTSYSFNTSNQITEMIEEYWDRQANRYVAAYKLVYSNFQTIASAPTEAAELLTEVYPNPTSGRISITYSQPASQATVTLTDITGRTVHQNQLVPSALQHELDLSTFPSGLYLLQVTAGNVVATRKVVKQ